MESADNLKRYEGLGFQPDDVLESISALSLLNELKTGYNTFSILILTHKGDVIYANQIAVNGFAGETVESIKGKNVRTLGPQEWMDERIGYFQQAISEDRPIIVIEAIEGVRLCTRLASIKAIVNGSEQDLVLITVEPILAMDLSWFEKRKDKFNIIMAKHIDLGILNKLSDREIEILALMGRGLRQKEIAQELCRSVSTINRHRESIGEKLGITDRAVLIRLANMAILQVEDANRIRMPINPQSSVHLHQNGYQKLLSTLNPPMQLTEPVLPEVQ